MSLFVVDVESDGPVPPQYSMICFGAVMIDQAGKLDKTFYSERMEHISVLWDPEALAISNISREEQLGFTVIPQTVMTEFAKWIEDVNESGKPTFISDNLAYDWQWINYYFHTYCKSNIFGYSGRRIGDLYCGLTGDMHSQWKHLRQTKHTHNPVDDAKGNAEVILHMFNNMNLRR